MRRPAVMLPLLFVAAGAFAADTFDGRWKPDQDANNRLAQAVAPLPAGNARPGPPGAMREKGGGGKGGMGRHRGREHGDDRAVTPSERSGGNDALDERLAPRVADLMVARQGDDVAIGDGDANPLQLRVDGDAATLPGGKANARLTRSGDDLVLEIHGDDGTKTTHTYRLEGDGKRLRVLTSTLAPGTERPSESQRLYRRDEAQQP